MHDLRPLRVFIGWDGREQDAYDVCAYSLWRHSSIALDIRPLKLSRLRDCGLYWRPDDPLASTEFAFSRFLVPYLARFTGPAVFMDCDFLWTTDIAAMMARIDASKAVSCVQHDYQPTETVKMDGAPQSAYPRKNWSSLMVFNAGHIACRALSPMAVNARSGAYLHRFRWAFDHEIGAIEGRWNWLEGWDQVAPGELPAAIHYTRGGPWFPAYRDVQFADLWREELARAHRARPGFAR